MKRAWVLYLNDYQARVYLERAGTLETADFAGDAEGAAAFRAWLRESPRGQAHLLVDSRQEEYLIDRVPHILGNDRRTMLALRLKRAFGKTPYRYALSHGRERGEKTARAIDRILLMALNQPEMLTPWLGALLAEKVPVRGIHSLPLLSQSLLKLLPNGAQYTLVVAHTPAISAYNPGGLRQSFFIGPHLAVSRLIPLNELGGPGYAEYLAWEVIKAQQYLVNQRLLAEDQTLRVVVLGDAALQLRDLQGYLSRHGSAELDYRLLDIHQAADALGLKHPSAPLLLDTLIAHQILRRGASNHYASAGERHYFTQFKLRRGIQWAGALALLAGLGTGGYYLAQALENERQIEGIQDEIVRLGRENHELEAAHQTLTGLPFPVAYVQHTVEAAERLQRRHVPPAPGLVALSQVLSQFDPLKVQTIAWETRSAADLEPAVAPPQTGAAMPKMGALAAAMQQKRQAAHSQLSATLRQVLTVEFRLEGQRDPFAAQRLFEDFRSKLEQHPQVRRVKPLQLPSTLSPDQPIDSGMLSQSQGKDTVVSLQIEIGERDDASSTGH